MLVLDIASAFPSVLHEWIVRVLQGLGAPDYVVQPRNEARLSTLLPDLRIDFLALSFGVFGGIWEDIPPILLLVLMALALLLAIS
eukprot:3541799-Pyramimonas_sp.AAC.1